MDTFIRQSRSFGIWEQHLAMRIFKTFFSVTVCSVVLSVCCAISGILLSILAGSQMRICR